MKDQSGDPRQWNEAGDVVQPAMGTGKTAAMRTTWQPANGAGDAGSPVHTGLTGLRLQLQQQPLKLEEPTESATKWMSSLMVDVAYCCYVPHCQTAEVICLNCTT